MADPRSVQRCRWAEPTLFIVELLWTEAEACPWTCRADGAPRLVEDTTMCTTCGRWVPRDAVCGEGCCGVTNPFVRP